ncbi:MAG: hypothetical protein HFJ89_04965 [Oscillospiraceae bacterium]|jgi:hypothetical protein|nr:hypothetical protein [Oscillospiraceae bacterium]
MAGMSATAAKTKTEKSDKTEKSAKPAKSAKTSKSAKNTKTTKTAKTENSVSAEITDKSAKASKAEKQGNGAKTDKSAKSDKTPANAKSNKTEAVMRLLTGGKKTAPNPILDSSFKVERITSKSIRKGANGAEIDITGELVTELLPQVLERFNCCRCAVCYAEAMAEAIDAVPTLKIRINGKDDLRRADRMKMQSRREVLCTLIRLAIQRRRFPRHNAEIR